MIVTGKVIAENPPIANDCAIAKALPATTFPMAPYMNAAVVPATGPIEEKPNMTNPALVATNDAAVAAPKITPKLSNPLNIDFIN